MWEGGKQVHRYHVEGGRVEEGVERLCNSPKQKPVICNCEVGDLKWRERLVNEAILEYKR